MLLALSVFWTERPWWEFLGVLWSILPYTKLSVWVDCLPEIRTQWSPSQSPSLPSAHMDRVSEWVGQSSEGKVTESQPHAESSAPLFSFLHWGWNLDRAAGTPRCCANGSHRLVSTQQEPGCQLWLQWQRDTLPPCLSSCSPSCSRRWLDPSQWRYKLWLKHHCTII